MEKYRIKISRSDYAENPFENWDCEPAVMAKFQRHTSDYSQGEIQEFIASKLTGEVILDNKDEFLDIAGVNLDYFEGDEDELIQEIIEYMDYSDVSSATKILELLDLPHLSYTSRGYSQGDWADVLIVATDEFFDRTGCNREKVEEILEGAASLFDNWAWGDVFEFEVQKAVDMVSMTAEDFDNKNFENADMFIEWEHFDSCSGFYGEDIDGVISYSGAPKEAVEEAFYYNNIDKWIKYSK